MAHAKPSILYKEAFEPSSLETVKIDSVVRWAVRSKKVPIFTATAGVEGLFHVIDHYKKAATKLVLGPAELWDQFEEVLDMTAKQSRVILFTEWSLTNKHELGLIPIW